MRVVRPPEAIPSEVTQSIFLAGPTPRAGCGTDVSWRAEALALLAADERFGSGSGSVVYVPEPLPDGGWAHGYDAQVDWEERCLHAADAVVFWVPRDAALPGFTTNVEFGAWVRSGKVAVLGAPPSAERMRYLQTQAAGLGVPCAQTLAETLGTAVAALGGGAPRRGAECFVPLRVWLAQPFQSWLAAQRRAGNALLPDARVEWSWWPGSSRALSRSPPFFFALRVRVAVAAEAGRVKENELLLSRPDVSATVLWCRSGDGGTVEVLLAKEFRSPGITPDGYVWDLPSGSSHADAAADAEHQSDPRVVAAEECGEEVGVAVDVARLKYHGTRQIAATMSLHRAHLFSAELTQEEVAAIRARTPEQRCFGVNADTEHTFAELVPLQAIREAAGVFVDFAVLGMILQVLA